MGQPKETIMKLKGIIGEWKTHRKTIGNRRKTNGNHRKTRETIGKHLRKPKGNHSKPENHMEIKDQRKS